MSIYDTVLSCILGLAAGDALGVPYEFMRRDQAEAAELEHMRSGGWHQQPAGAWSDDTAMALASMDYTMPSAARGLSITALSPLRHARS